MENVLRVENLSIEFNTARGISAAVRGVSLVLPRGKTLAIVGESGCGKSVLCKSIIGLLPKRGRITGGKILLDGINLAELSEKELCEVRGKRIALIPQNPMSALDPTLTIGAQLAECMPFTRRGGRDAAKGRALTLLRQVGISDAERIFSDYPHMLSGGMLQRAVIAAAVSSEPELLLADEPTTALDAVVQLETLELLLSLQRESGISMLLITHDLGVAAKTAHNIAVMREGEIVETGTAEETLLRPRHPYTRELLCSESGMREDNANGADAKREGGL